MIKNILQKVKNYIKKNKYMGSGILVVILTALVFMVYSSSTYAEQEHYQMLQKKYENDIINYYNSDVNNIDEVYQNLINNNQSNTNNNIENY